MALIDELVRVHGYLRRFDKGLLRLLSHHLGDEMGLGFSVTSKVAPFHFIANGKQTHLQGWKSLVGFPRDQAILKTVSVAMTLSKGGGGEMEFA